MRRIFLLFFGLIIFSLSLMISPHGIVIAAKDMVLYGDGDEEAPHGFFLSGEIYGFVNLKSGDAVESAKLGLLGGYRFSPRIQVGLDVWSLLAIAYGFELTSRWTFLQASLSPFLVGSAGILLTPLDRADNPMLTYSAGLGMNLLPDHESPYLVVKFRKNEGSFNNAISIDPSPSIEIGGGLSWLF